MFYVKYHKRPYAILLILGVLLVSLLEARSVVSAQEGGAGSYLRLLRTVPTGELGVPNPVGIVFSPERNAFLLLKAPAKDQLVAGISIGLVTPFEDHVGDLAINIGIPASLNVTYDTQAGSVLVYDQTNKILAVVKLDLLPSIGAISLFDANEFVIDTPQDMALDPASGDLYILDAAKQEIVRITPSANPTFRFDSEQAVQENRVSKINLSQLGQVQLRGLAFNSSNSHLYVMSPTEKKLYELTEGGVVVSTRDMSSIKLIDPQGMTFAPSADLTDDPTIMNLYFVDSGLTAGRAATGEGGGSLMEVSLTEPDSAPQPQASMPGAVQIIDTSAWSPPSPDPSGLTYIPSSNTLIVSDSEVNEVAIFAGVNMFESTLDGSLVGSFSTTNFSNEPTGVTINPSNGHLFISDDNSDRITEIDPGPDGQYGTSDDSFTFFDTRAFNSFDPEGVGFDSDQGHLFITDGVNAEVYEVSPGANGIFDGVPPEGDDQVSSFDTSILGLLDPECVTYNPDDGTLFIVSRGNSVVMETTTTGTAVRVIDISSLNPIATAGVAYGPNSVNPAARSVYVTDRGIDNNEDPNENDGKIFEVSLDTLPQVTNNMFANPGFEFDANADGFPDSWSINSRAIRSSDVCTAGNFSIRHQATDNATYVIRQLLNNIVAGTTYSFGGQVKIPSTSDAFEFKLLLVWRDASNNPISVENIRTYTASTIGWSIATATLTAPAGTMNAEFRMIVKSLNGTIYVDELVFGT